MGWELCKTSTTCRFVTAIPHESTKKPVPKITGKSGGDAPWLNLLINPSTAGLAVEKRSMRSMLFWRQSGLQRAGREGGKAKAGKRPQLALLCASLHPECPGVIVGVQLIPSRPRHKW